MQLALRVALLRGGEQLRAPDAALCRPSQVETLIRFRAVQSICVSLERVFRAVLFERDIAETCARHRAEAARLAEIADAGQIAAQGIERVLKMFLRAVELAG